MLRDICTRKVVGWRISSRIDEEPALRALRNSISQEKDLKDLIIHTDRDSRHTSRRYYELNKILSMISSGNLCDNK